MNPANLQHCIRTRIPNTTLIGACLMLAFTIAFAAGPPMDILNARNPRVQAVMAVQNEYTPVLLRLPGVVGTATGLNADGELAIKVYVESAGVVGLPPFLSGVPVDIEVSGMFVARLDTTDAWPRPVPIGVSTGHPQITAGTLGCRVVDDFGNLFALSNNHVYANSNDANLGDPQILDDGDVVLQPGSYDGGSLSQGHGIGRLFDFEPIRFDGAVNTIDAAIAYVTPDFVGFATPHGIGYGVPSANILPLENVKFGVVNNPNATQVQKVGRTTNHTVGTVDAINWSGNICYETRGPFMCVKLAYFENQILISPGNFSAGGDSGSLIVTADDNRPVALLFAGSNVHTIANPIEFVLGRFNVTIDDGTTPGDGNGSGGNPDPEPDPEPDPDPVIGSMVASLSGSSASINRNFWRATVIITVTDAGTETGVAGANVTGTWSTGGSVSAVTDSNGTASVTSGNLRQNVGQVTYTLTDVTHPDYELDLNSANQQTTISKP